MLTMERLISASIILTVFFILIPLFVRAKEPEFKAIYGMAIVGGMFAFIFSVSMSAVGGA